MHLIYCIQLLAAVLTVAAKSPTGNYAPGTTTCPLTNTSFLREGNSISDDEKDWLKQRHKKTDLALADYLEYANMTDFDVDDFFDNLNSSVNVALAFSGGGYRAMLTGAGQLAALDNRTGEVGSDNALNGVYQSSTYLAGLSGGSWLVGLLALQDFPSIDEVVFEDPNDVWNMTDSRQLVNASSLVDLVFPALFGNVKKLLTYISYSSGSQGIAQDVENKNNAGYVTTVTDSWGRGLAHQLLPKGKDNYGDATTWSDIRDIKSFKNHDSPFPLVLALGRKPGSLVYNINSTVVEFNPFEMGSFDASLNSFTDIKYIGTNVTNGKSKNGSCIAGFDNAAFVMGTSSSLFNEFLNTLACKNCHTLNFAFKYVVKRLLDKLSNAYFDVASYNPNPFYKSEYAGLDSIANNDTLYLIDGGLSGEQIPLGTLMTKERALDAVFAFDNTADWPNGSSLVATYGRQFGEQGKSTICPYVPDEVSFLKQNLSARPTFFGCNGSNLTDLQKDGVTPPVVIYIANRPFEYYSNVSTYKLEYTDAEKKAMIQNGYDTATRMNSTLDDEWPACVACAMVRREQERQGMEQSEQCQKCFQQYCWDGTISPEKGTYYRPVNFTKDGLTNHSMSLWNQKTEVSSDAEGSTVWSIFKSIFR